MQESVYHLEIVILSSNITPPSIKEQSQFWDSHWRQAKERKVVNPWTERRAETILQHIRALSIQRPNIVDCGCGDGWFTERLDSANFGGEVWGVDLSAEAIANAKARRPHIQYVSGDICQAAIPEGHFDVAVSQEVIAHVENQPNYVEKVSRILKPGGYLIMTTGNKFVMDRLGDVGWIQYPSEHIENELTSTQMKRLLRAHFKLLSFGTIIPHGTKGILRIVNSPRLAALFVPLIGQEKFDGIKERAGFGYQMVALVQKKSAD